MMAHLLGAQRPSGPLCKHLPHFIEEAPFIFIRLRLEIG